MDFNALVSKLRSIEPTDISSAPVAKPAEPKAKPVVLSEDAQMRVLAGVSTILAETQIVAEKAVSKSQQQAAGIALAAKKKGETPKGKGAAAEMAKMSTKELEKFAGTKHKGLPKKKKTNESYDDLSGLGEANDDQLRAWYKKYNQYDSADVGSLADGMFKFFQDSGVDLDTVEKSEYDALVAKHGEDKIQGNALKFLSDEDTPITKAMFVEFKRIMGQADEESVERAVSMLGMDEGLGEGQYDGKSREELLKMKAQAEAEIENFQAKGGNDPSGQFLDDTDMMMMKQHLAAINNALKKLGESFDRESFRKTIEAIAEAKSKPDFLDMDKDGDKKEPMKKAIADKKKGAVGKKVKEAEEKRAPAKKSEREVKLPSGAKVKATKVQGWQSRKADKEAEKEMKEGKYKSDAQRKAVHANKMKKESVKESMRFLDAIKIVKESNGEMKIDAVDTALWNWAKRVAESKVQEGGLKAEAFAAKLYESYGGEWDVSRKVLSE